jgi:hypothetical protein
VKKEATGADIVEALTGVFQACKMSSGPS